MRDMKLKVRCTKRKMSKCEEIVKTYDKVQSVFCEVLEADENIISYQCNVPIAEYGGRTFTTDFVCFDVNGNTCVWECVYRKQLSLPRTCKLLDISKGYWQSKGIMNWGIVVEASDENKRPISA